MIQIEDEDIVVLTCASKKSTDTTLYRCDEKRASRFCICPTENTENTSCLCVFPKGEVEKSLCSCSQKIGKEIKFVAKLNNIPEDDCEYVRLDDSFGGENGKTWRTLFKEFNDKHNEQYANLANKLSKAYELYKPRNKETLYKDLHDELKERFYILSAGWGLIPADYLLPNYDITFKSKEKYKEISMNDINIDLYENSKESISKLEGKTIHFFGGQGYWKLFSKLLCGVDKQQYIWHHQKPFPEDFKGQGQEFFINKNTNWQYEAVEEVFIKSLVVSATDETHFIKEINQLTDHADTRKKKEERNKEETDKEIKHDREKSDLKKCLKLFLELGKQGIIASRNMFDYPLKIYKSERPDFTLEYQSSEDGKNDRRLFGVEITELVDQAYQEAQNSKGSKNDCELLGVEAEELINQAYQRILASECSKNVCELLSADVVKLANQAYQKILASEEGKNDHRLFDAKVVELVNQACQRVQDSKDGKNDCGLLGVEVVKSVNRAYQRVQNTGQYLASKARGIYFNPNDGPNDKENHKKVFKCIEECIRKKEGKNYEQMSNTTLFLYVDPQLPEGYILSDTGYNKNLFLHLKKKFQDIDIKFNAVVLYLSNVSDNKESLRNEIFYVHFREAPEAPPLVKYTAASENWEVESI